MDSLRINPAKATCQKFADGDYGLQAINDTCFGICAAFSGTYDTYQIDPKCAQSCEDLVEQRKMQIFSVGSCDHQVPYRPVIWQQTGRYVPELIRRGANPIQAKDQCLQLCQTHDKMQATDCMDNCILDFNAIEGFDPANYVNTVQPVPVQPKIIPKFKLEGVQAEQVKDKAEQLKAEQAQGETKSKKNVTIIIAMCLILLIIIYLLYRMNK